MQGGTISIGAAPGLGPAIVGTPQLACRLELDINTSAENTNLIPLEHIRQLFEELVNLGYEIADKGDIP